MIEGVIKITPTCTVSEDDTIALSVDTRLAKPTRGRSSTRSQWGTSNREKFLDSLQEALEIAGNSRLSQFSRESTLPEFAEIGWNEEALNRSWTYDVDSIVRAGIDHLQSQNNIRVERALPEEERIGSRLNWDRALKRDFQTGFE
ncbi:hypothetical protein V866_003145 [Kwoniella sp. B9012]|uniref:Uncharacterized protein n=1 Tax=Kwoniella europaea PYCC6329 TaxID=1423913 RepID=A0AAX4KG86_9TREE